MTKAETATLRVSKRAAELVREIAAGHGITPRQYLEALLHYGGSCHKRPGSWEAARPFELQSYLDPESPADRWF